MSIRGFQSDVVDNWNLGVITSILSDRLPDGAVPYCRDGQFRHVGPDMAIFGTRDGATLQNEVSIASAVCSQYQLVTETEKFHLLINEDGDIATFAGGTATDILAAAFTPAVFNQYSWQTMNELA